MEVNCSFVLVCFVFNAALYNEKVGVNERKRKRRTTIRLYIFMELHVINAFSYEVSFWGVEIKVLFSIC